MEKDEYSKLLDRYLSALDEGKEAYFDADEILYLLDCFEDDDNLDYYDGVLAVGLRLYPANIDLKIKQCRALILEDKYKEALKLSNTLSEKYNEELDNIRLECYFYLEDYETAYEYLNVLIGDLSCTYIIETLEHLAIFLNDMELTDTAEELIRYGLILAPDNVILNNELCYLYELRGDTEEAIELCNEMLDRDPYLYDFWFTLGRLHSLNNDYDKAIEAFDFACTCEEPDMELLILKAYCFFMNENYKKAIEIYKELISDKEPNLHAKALMAECYIKLDEFEPAYQLLKDIINRKGSIFAEASAYINYIRCCVETDREQEASKMLFKATDLFPDNVRILSLLALAYLENGKEDLALSVTDKIFKQLEQVNRENPDDSERLLQKEFADFFRQNKSNDKLPVFSREENKYIPPEELTREFLRNKTNNN